MIQWNKERKRC